MSNIVLLNNFYKYELPPIPPEKEIWYHNVPRKSQYWKTPENKDFRWLNPDNSIKDVKKMQERERIEYVNYWRDKWLNGLWFMCNGSPTYITGTHVEHLIFNKFAGKNLFYLDSQRKRFYFRDLTNKERLCDGRVWVKPRRAGLTTEQITEAIRVVLSDYGNKVGMQSTTLEICNRTLMKPIIDTYINRPSWMREIFYTSNGRKPIKELQLTASVINEDEQYLGGIIKSFPTVASALDGDGWMLVIGDEKSKWETCSPYETLEINKKAIVNPGKRGKIDALSTCGDSKDAAKATIEWHKLIADSNPKIRNANEKTNSGLWLYFESAINSLLLLEEIPEVLDKYGNINEDMARTYVLNDINKHPKDSKEYIYAKYKMPLELRDALLTPTTHTYFSKIRITNRLDELRLLPNDRKPYVRGKLVENSAGKVFFEADPMGPWLVAIHPYFSTERNIDARNRFKVSDGVHFPPINPEFCIGYDPIRYRKEDTTSTSLSRAAATIHKKFDYFNPVDSLNYCSDKRAALLLYRPDDPDEAHKEIIKACKYWGAPCMHERNIEKVKEVFENHGMLPFLLKSEKDGKYGLYTDPAGKVTKNGIDMLVSRYSPPKEKGETDFIAEHPFEDSLMDLDTFDIANTHKSDVVMSEIMCEYGLKQILLTNKTDSQFTNMITAAQSIVGIR